MSLDYRYGNALIAIVALEVYLYTSTIQGPTIPVLIPSDVFETSVYYWIMLSLRSTSNRELFHSALLPRVILSFF